jgi:hypothetical protein
LWATNFEKKKKTTSFTKNNFNNCPNDKGTSDTLFRHRRFSSCSRHIVIDKVVGM